MSRIAQLEKENAELLEALQVLVESDKRDNMADQDVIATARWKHEAWSNAYAIIAGRVTE